MSNDLELLNDNVFEDNDNMKEEIFEADLIMQEELSDDFDEIVEIEEDTDIDDKEEIVINNINYNDDDVAESELDIYFKYGTNNHKLDGKHKLKRDTIFNGKVDMPSENEDEAQLYGSEFDGYDSHIDHMSTFEEDSRNATELHNRKRLSEDVYYLLKENTDLDFNSNRRKPNKATFNNYYKMLLMNIDSQYTKSEIFVELAYYFTDNIFNMYKLLDKKYATTIILELREKGFLNNLNNFKFM